MKMFIVSGLLLSIDSYRDRTTLPLGILRRIISLTTTAISAIWVATVQVQAVLMIVTRRKIYSWKSTPLHMNKLRSSRIKGSCQINVSSQLFIICLKVLLLEVSNQQKISVIIVPSESFFCLSSILSGWKLILKVQSARRHLLSWWKPEGILCDGLLCEAMNINGIL